MGMEGGDYTWGDIKQAEGRTYASTPWTVAQLESELHELNNGGLKLVVWDQFTETFRKVEGISRAYLVPYGASWRELDEDEVVDEDKHDLVIVLNYDFVEP